MQADLLVPALLLASAGVALGFHRHRAAQIALLLGLLAAGAGAESARLVEGALRFLPLCAVIVTLVPEARLLSRRHAAFVLVLALLAGTTLDAPYTLFHSMAEAAAGPFASLRPASSAAILLAVAATVCSGRWLWRGAPVELGCGLGLGLAALAVLVPVWAALAWMVAAACLLLSILWGSYRMAFLDQLTGLPNRRALDETLGRLSGDYAIAMLDVDHFKNFNDSHGHDAGDVVLREVASQLRRHAGAAAFRYGGEEFCVVYPGRRAGLAADQLENVRTAIESQRIAIRPAGKSGAASATRKRKDVSVTISAGCARRDASRRAPSEVLKAADQALYKAKKKGRNQVVVA